jgi:hypothetical protein
MHPFVWYTRSVTNTGQQVLDSNGDRHRWQTSVGNLNFGELAIGSGPTCTTVANPNPAVLCTGTDPNNPDVHTCICAEVEGTNTAVITSAICQATNDSACDLTLHPDSDCSDDANVVCTTPSVA